MATEEWIKRAITNGKTYDELPPRVKSLLPLTEWKLKCAFVTILLRVYLFMVRNAAHAFIQGSDWYLKRGVACQDSIFKLWFPSALL